MFPKCRSQTLKLTGTAHRRLPKRGRPPAPTGSRQCLKTPLEGGGLSMSVPAPREPRHGGSRWETIRYALDSWPRTFRLCLILAMTTVVSTGMATAVATLIRHLLLCPIVRTTGLGPDAHCPGLTARARPEARPEGRAARLRQLRRCGSRSRDLSCCRRCGGPSARRAAHSGLARASRARRLHSAEEMIQSRCSWPRSFLPDCGSLHRGATCLILQLTWHARSQDR